MTDKKAMEFEELCQAALAKVRQVTGGDVVSVQFGEILVIQVSPGKWVVRLRGEVLNRDWRWEWEPSPSHRDAEFIDRTRFSCGEALSLAQGAKLKLEAVNLATIPW